MRRWSTEEWRAKCQKSSSLVEEWNRDPVTKGCLLFYPNTVCKIMKVHLCCSVAELFKESTNNE